MKRKVTTRDTTQKSDLKQVGSKNVKEGKLLKKRDLEEFPNLVKSSNTKLRQDYLDNIHYVDGVKHRDEQVMRPLNNEEKAWLDKFNSEFYGASFSKDDSENLHQNKVDDVTLYNLRNDLSILRKDAARADKDGDVELAKELYLELEEQVEYLKEVYPKKKCTDANNSRNRCLLNVGKATNEVKFIAWESLNQNLVGDLDVDLLYILNNLEEVDIDDE